MQVEQQEARVKQEVKMKHKVKQGRNARRGETFVELLIAVLVVAFASLLVTVMYSAAFSADIEAEKNDTTYYGALSDMESMGKDGGELNVKIEDKDGGSATVDAEKFGNGTYSSYRKGN